MVDWGVGERDNVYWILMESGFSEPFASEIYVFEKVYGIVVHSLGFSAEWSGFESRPSESMKLFSTCKLILSTQNSTNRL
jgi:hypothetical protein